MRRPVLPAARVDPDADSDSDPETDTVSPQAGTPSQGNPVGVGVGIGIGIERIIRLDTEAQIEHSRAVPRPPALPLWWAMPTSQAADARRM